MKKKTLTLVLIICAVLAVILVSVMALTAANNNPPAPKGDGTSPQSQQENAPVQDPAQLLDSTRPNCILILNDWSVQNNILTIDAFGQAFLPGAEQFDARIDFWKNNEVLESKPLALTPGEGTGSYETEFSANFKIPELGADEQLQIWLIVELAEADVVYSCGASWYLEGDQLMLITG